MTTTLKLTPDAATASVLVEASTDAAGLTLMRSDQNGTAPVRLLAGAGGASVVERDHEPALVGPVIYTATTTTPVELRRNRFANPSTASATPDGFTTSSSQATVSKEAAAVRFTLSAIGAIAIGIMPQTGSFSLGDSVRMLIRARASRPLSPLARFGHSTSYEMAGPALTTEWQWLNVTALAAGSPTSNSTNWGLVLRSSSSTWVAGDWIEIDRVLYAGGDDTGQFFDGSTPGAEWTGAPNASPSVIRGIESVERVVRFDEGPHEVEADVWSIAQRPQWSAQGRLTTDVRMQRASAGTRHEVIGRPDPVYTLRRGGYRTGTVQVLCLDFDGVAAFEQLVTEGGIVHARMAALSPGRRLLADLYAVIERVEWAPISGTAPWRFMVTLTLGEVRRPDGPLLGNVGWTYDALAGLDATYETLPMLFESYADLAAGVMSDA